MHYYYYYFWTLDPMIIRLFTSCMFVSNKNNEDYRYWIYPLPSAPFSMTDSFLNQISYEEKTDIIRGIVRGVASMHHADPPFR